MLDREEPHEDDCRVPLCSSLEHKRGGLTPLNERDAEDRRRELIKIIHSHVRPCVFNNVFNKQYTVKKCFVCKVKFPVHMPFYWLTHLFGIKHFKKLYNVGSFYTEEGLWYYETHLSNGQNEDPVACGCKVCETVRGKSSFVPKTGESCSVSEEHLSERNRSPFTEHSEGSDTFTKPRRRSCNKLEFDDVQSSRALEEKKNYYEGKLRERDARNEVLLRELKEKKFEIQKKNAIIEENNKLIVSLTDTNKQLLSDRVTVLEEGTKVPAKKLNCEGCLTWRKNFDALECRFLAVKQLAVKYKKFNSKMLGTQEKTFSNVQTNTDSNTDYDNKQKLCLKTEIGQLKRKMMSAQNELFQDPSCTCANSNSCYSHEMLIRECEQLKHELNVEKARPVMENMLAMIHNEELQAFERHVSMLTIEIEKLKEKAAREKQQAENGKIVMNDEIENLKRNIINSNYQMVKLTREKNKLAVEKQEVTHRSQEMLKNQMLTLKKSVEELTKINEVYRARLAEINKISILY